MKIWAEGKSQPLNIHLRDFPVARYALLGGETKNFHSNKEFLAILFGEFEGRNNLGKVILC